MPEYPINLKRSEPDIKAYGPENYPRLHLHWDDQYSLPEDGTMTVKFHKCRQTDTNEEGDMSQSVELEILSIESVKAVKSDAPPKKDRDIASDALDAALAESEEGY